MRLTRTGWTTTLAIAVFASVVPGLAHAQSAAVRDLVARTAEQLSREPYRAPQPQPEAGRITYTDYMGIRVKPGQEIWGREKIGFALHPMPLGGLHATPVAIDIVEGNGTITPIATGPGFYEHSLPKDHVPPDENLGISGFRITAPLNSGKTLDELIVFQGASYFRALSKGQDYGLSARGLSIDAGQPKPEEFPQFRHFWVEKPDGPRKLVIHALLDSPSVTGAFVFQIYPGAPTAIDVEAAIFPRQDLASVGIAPLTSMYFYSVGDNATSARDYRPAVHDSDGLLVANGNNERLWRPLRNPATLRASSFGDSHPKGFGLMQRQRDFSQYQDLEARYHRRPSAWVEPRGDWGTGSVELFELPTDSEYHDNIVTQWKPSDPLRAGQRYDFAYRLSWPDRAPEDSIGAIVNWTRSGPAGLPSVSNETERFVIDYKLTDKNAAVPLPEAQVTSSAGAVSGVTVQHNAMTGGLRVSFLFDPGAEVLADLRLDLSLPNARAEVWLYQWASRHKPDGAL